MTVKINKIKDRSRERRNLNTKPEKSPQFFCKTEFGGKRLFSSSPRGSFAEGLEAEKGLAARPGTGSTSVTPADGTKRGQKCSHSSAAQP